MPLAKPFDLACLRRVSHRSAGSRHRNRLPPEGGCLSSEADRSRLTGIGPVSNECSVLSTSEGAAPPHR